MSCCCFNRTASKHEFEYGSRLMSALELERKKYHYVGGGSSTPKIMKLDFLFLLSFSATFMCKCPSLSLPSLG
ncbi:putative beta-glucosidase I [Fusarium oxysporum f. sp. albedinis]|nr:putative beta-glucosidase I [Fusarium oxysporum f. sp. albedinis]